MSEDLNTSTPSDGPPLPRGRRPRASLKAINGALVGVGSIYLATESITVTVIGASVAVVLTIVYLLTS
jgi:hypothetical protein